MPDLTKQLLPDLRAHRLSPGAVPKCDLDLDGRSFAGAFH